tara:strand:- start:5867 stop:6343 length:477 start_codon:yes stop_codon:yes gene_type:complete
MNNYKFYERPGLNAKVGIAFNGKYFALYFPSMGSSPRRGKPNVRRNPDRYRLHKAMIGTLCDAGAMDTRLDSLVVQFYAAGSKEKGKDYQSITKVDRSDLYSFGPNDIPGHGNYAYTLYLESFKLVRGFSNDEQCDSLASYLGLKSTKSARPIEVRWI